MSSYSQVFLCGIVNAVQLHKTILFMLASRVTARKTLQCFVLNGVIFLGSILIFDHGLKPLVFYLGDSIKSLHVENLVLEDRTISLLTEEYWELGKKASVSIHELRKSLKCKGKQSVDQAISVTFTVLWLTPMYLLSFVLNTVWYREIAEQGTNLSFAHSVSFHQPIHSLPARKRCNV